MKIKLLFLFTLGCLMCYAQNHRFIYEVRYKKDKNATDFIKENYHLDVSKDEVTYYIRDFFAADSLINNNIPFPKDMVLNTSALVVHKPASNIYEEYDLLENSAFKLRSEDSQTWKLSDDKKVIKNLTLQKATSTWGGRNWTAWFSADLPFQEGPYRFHGLPGLIVELYDEQNDYHFNLVRTENLKQVSKNQFLEVTKQMGVLVDWDRYKKAKLAYYDSPVSFIKNAAGTVNSNDGIFLNDGTKVTSSNIREVNERLKSNIRKDNNPVDLTRVISYP
ncbi:MULTISPECIES: GLPGLI family protein [Elizabethkingia]|uniref:GLPGLI family protein n=1 Tax=Elizabethkingia TaxID=308865 RepID=UPI0020A18D50|nr:GLPGLI family protein [Elizabethkingia sp. S0634]MCP1251470.1 GLPGLI family protein [Elizabethkingia sp. S0634]